jgi:hypothetical protein
MRDSVRIVSEPSASCGRCHLVGLKHLDQNLYQRCHLASQRWSIDEGECFEQRLVGGTKLSSDLHAVSRRWRSSP